MSEPVPEETPETSDLLEDALLGLMGCVGTALNEEGQPGVCSYSITIGEVYVPFAPDEADDCDEDDEACEQAWIRVMSVHPTASGISAWGGDSCSLELSIDLEIGVLRCIETPEGGEAPSATDVLVAAMQALDDMRVVLCAVLGCEVWDSIDVGEWAPSGPLGGQYGGTWSFTVTL